MSATLRIGKGLPHQRILDAAAAALLLGLTATGYMLGVSPVVEASREERRLRAEASAKTALVSDLVSTRADLERRVSEARRQAAEKSVRLELTSHLNSRLATLTAFAADAGLAVAGMESREAPPDPRWARVRLRIAGRGGYEACAGFLARVHESFPDTEVTSLTLTSNPEDPAAGASFVFDLVWYAAPAGSAGR